MGKTRKSKPKFKHNVNRRRVNAKDKKVGHFSACGKIVKKAWKPKATLRSNMANMGLAFDPNEVLKIPKSKDTLKTLMSGEPVTRVKSSAEAPQAKSSKAKVVNELETFAKLPRERKFALPQSQVMFLTYLLDKYGEDYKAMVRDRKNIYQETWKQLRAKVQVFKGVPSQWEEYLQHREELEKEEDES